MKSLFISILFLGLSFATAQTLKDTIFLDKDWGKCDRDTATYYRLEERQGDLNFTQDFYISTHKPQSIGTETFDKPPVREGKWTWYYENGSPEHIANYRGGEKEGAEQYWFENGQKKDEVEWENGKRLMLNAWKENGDQMVTVGSGWFADTSIIDNLGDEDTLIVSGQYEEKLQTGLWKRTYFGGQAAWQGHFAKGKREGKWEAWHKNGQKMQEKTFQGGEPQGSETFWYANGQKAFMTVYENGAPVKKMTWNPEGELVHVNTSPWVEMDDMVISRGFGALEPTALNMNEIRQKVGYPEIAVDAGIQGQVVIRVLVTREGIVKKHKIIRNPHILLTNAVSAQIHMLKFVPAIQGGVSIPFWVNIPFTFRLIEDEVPKKKKTKRRKRN